MLQAEFFSLKTSWFIHVYWWDWSAAACVFTPKLLQLYLLWTAQKDRTNTQQSGKADFLWAYEVFISQRREQRRLESNIRASCDQNEPIKQQLQNNNREEVELEFHYIRFLSHLFICSSCGAVSRTVCVETSALTWTHLLRKHTHTELWLCPVGSRFPGHIQVFAAFLPAGKERFGSCWLNNKPLNEGAFITADL